MFNIPFPGNKRSTSLVQTEQVKKKSNDGSLYNTSHWAEYGIVT